MKKLILCATVMVGLNANMPKPPPIDTFSITKLYDEKYKEPMTPRNVYQYLIRRHVRNADIVFRQILQETGHLTSRLCREGNNLFGMVAHGKHKSKGGYAHFPDWKQSVVDYEAWQLKHIRRGMDLSDYYVFLNRVRYAEDPFYTWKLKQINIKKYAL